MTPTPLQSFDILAARAAYANGQNITALLRRQKNTAVNTPEIIELAYDLQAGSYIAHAAYNAENTDQFNAEVAAILSQHCRPNDTLLDIGTGEMTTLSGVVPKMALPPRQVLAFDISWSRLHHGLGHARQHMGGRFERLVPFVADMGQIPLPDKSVNVTTSSHALEPNGGRLPALLAELFRVTRDKLVLVEPCYEINCDAGKQRMDRLGYIKNLPGVVAQLGGRVVETTRLAHGNNPLNPTVCFVVTPPAAVGAMPAVDEVDTGPVVFSVPGSNLLLRPLDGFYFSNSTGQCFPVLKTIPILRSSAAILATALGEH